MRASLRAAVFCLALVGVSLFAGQAHAYPWMIRHGFAECGDCHVDPMGGETLTGMGRVTGQTLLAMPWSEHPPTNIAKFAFGITEPDNVRLGGSLRAMAIDDIVTNNWRAFPMQADLYGAGFIGRFTLAASIGVSKASNRYEHSSKARLIGNIEDEGRLLVSRNHWLGFSLTEDLMLRLGRINLPFGLRIPEHTQWVRAETLTDRESDQQHGVSLVYSSAQFRGELMGVAGNFQIPRRYRDYGYSGYLEYMFEPNLGVGISSLFLTAPNELIVNKAAVFRHAHGLTLRWAPSREVVVLAEADGIKKTGAGIGYVGLATVDYEAVQSLHFSYTGEVLNRGDPTGDREATIGRGDTRLGSWFSVNWFFMAHGDIRLDTVIRQRRPAMLQAMIHFYL